MAAAPAASNVGWARLRRRQHAGQRRVAAAIAGPAADHRPARAPRRLHPADRADQLPGPATPRSSRMGMVDDAAPDRGIHGRRVRVRRGIAWQRRDRQRDRDRQRGTGRDRWHRPRSTSGSSRRRVADTRSSVPGGALLSSPINDFFGGQGGANTQLDVLQGDPARVRNLAVGFGSLRTIRAETPVTVPLIETNLRLEDGRLRGTVRNLSDERLEKPAVVLGGTVATLKDLEPGAEVDGGRARPEHPVRPIALGQGRGPDLLWRRPARMPIPRRCTSAIRWSTS